jgi:hypothetical protein
VGRIYKQIKERYNDIERQNQFVNVKQKRSLIFYCEIKLVWAREECVACCSRNEGRGIA